MADPARPPAPGRPAREPWTPDDTHRLAVAILTDALRLVLGRLAWGGPSRGGRPVAPVASAWDFLFEAVDPWRRWRRRLAEGAGLDVAALEAHLRRLAALSPAEARARLARLVSAPTERRRPRRRWDRDRAFAGALETDGRRRHE